MAAVVPNPRKTRSFRDAAAFEAWLAAHHASADELWLKIHKKGSGLATVSYDEAVDVALCWGWIDGLKKGFDERSFLQRFTPRKPKSVWSQANRDRVTRLEASGRMTPHGRDHVDAAKADGRWEAAYAGGATMQAPPDLLAAIEADPAALAAWRGLNRQNLYALCYRVGAMKTAAGRARKIADFVAMLARGETPYPNTTKRPSRAAGRDGR